MALRNPVSNGGTLSPAPYLRETHRTASADETLERLSPVAERIGITRVAVLTGLDRIGVPVVAVCRPCSRSLSVYQGKGVTLAGAKASGIMELIERFSAEYMRPPERIASQRVASRSFATLDPGIWPLPADAKPDAEMDIGWITGFDVMAEAEVHVPYPVVHFDRRIPGPAGSHLYVNTSTGLACGNTDAEAVLHALCEIVERDALTLWRLLPQLHQAMRRVALDTIADAANCALIAAIRAAGLHCAVFDIRSEIDVPVFVCRIVEPLEHADRTAAIVDGAGCHPNREVALIRAVTEAIQIRATSISGARNDLFRRFYAHPDPAEARRLIAEVAASDVGHPFTSIPSWRGASPAEDFAHILERLRRHLKHVVTIDLTHPETGIPAVRVLVPELEDGEEMPEYQPRERALRAYLGRR